MRVSEIRVKQIRVNQGLGVCSSKSLPYFILKWNWLHPRLVKFLAMESMSKFDG